MPEQRHTADTITDAALDQLYDDLARFRQGVVNNHRSMCEQHSRADWYSKELLKAEAAIARVREPHRRNPNTGDCEHCSEHDYPDYAVPQPCPTITALNGAEQQTGCRCHDGDELCSGCRRCPDVCNGCE